MRQFTIGVILVTLLVIIGWLTAYFLAVGAVHSAVNTSDKSWCPTLVAITAHPVPRPTDPAANPSRERAYRFYLIFLAQRNRFGC